MNIFFILFLALSSSNHWERYSHPKPESLYKELSQSLREDTRVNFITLQTSKYSFNFMKETIHNNSLLKENKFNEKKMMNRRKVDRMFSRHKNMILNIHKKSEQNLYTLETIHKKSEQNLYTLETIRKRVSDELSDLKRNHLTMIDRLIQNHKNVEDIYENKKQNHIDTIEEKYKEWKDKREEIIETIESL